MGDPRKARKKYTTPSHPWQKVRIDAERGVKNTYGVKTKKEIWKMDSLRKKFTSGAKALIAARTEQADKEREQIVQRLVRLGLLDVNAKFDDVLGMTLEDIMERRLQTRVWKQGLAKTATQARQFIIHGHIIVAGKKITMPSYIVSKSDESQIAFLPKSKFSDPEHPERIAKKQEVVSTVPESKKSEEKSHDSKSEKKEHKESKEKGHKESKDHKKESKKSESKKSEEKSEDKQ